MESILAGRVEAGSGLVHDRRLSRIFPEGLSICHITDSKLYSEN